MNTKMDAFKDDVCKLFAWLCFLTIFIGPVVAVCYLSQIQEEKFIKKLASQINSQPCKCESINK